MEIALTLTFSAAGGRIGPAVCPILPQDQYTIRDPRAIAQVHNHKIRWNKPLPGEPIPFFTGNACLPEDTHEQVDADLWPMWIWDGQNEVGLSP